MPGTFHGRIDQQNAIKLLVKKTTLLPTALNSMTYYELHYSRSAGYFDSAAWQVTDRVRRVPNPANRPTATSRAGVVLL